MCAGSYIWSCMQISPAILCLGVVGPGGEAAERRDGRSTAGTHAVYSCRFILSCGHVVCGVWLSIEGGTKRRKGEREGGKREGREGGRDRQTPQTDTTGRQTEPCSSDTSNRQQNQATRRRGPNLVDFGWLLFWVGGREEREKRRRRETLQGRKGREAEEG